MPLKPLRFDPMRFSKRVVSVEEFRRLVAEAAYHRAMNRSFAPGHELDDWLDAEREVTERVSTMPLSQSE